jgi:methylated-DNA-[protein]-cysteine S-methyltransferase
VTAVSPELDRRFRDAAARESLLDVAYDLVDSPIGTLFVAATERGFCRIAYDAEPERELERLAQTFGIRVLRSPSPIEPARRQLGEYFDGKRRRFELPLDVALLADFNRRVLHELVRVPYGEVVTYGELAARAARPRAARAVGTVMNRNPLPIVLPCHRVIGANGKLVGYGGGLERKEKLLRLEGALLA